MQWLTQPSAQSFIPMPSCWLFKRSEFICIWATFFGKGHYVSLHWACFWWDIEALTPLDESNMQLSLTNTNMRWQKTQKIGGKWYKIWGGKWLNGRWNTTIEATPLDESNMQLSLTILATESPPTRWCSSSEFSPLVLGADSTLLDSQPAVHRHCAAKARALKQTLVWTNVKSACSTL